MEVTVGRYDSQVKQEPEEFDALRKEIDAINPKIILEIGVLRGGVIAYYRDKVDKVIGIDFGTHPYGMGYNEYPDDVILANSHKPTTLDEVKRRLDGKKVDVLFIDGDHTANGCKMDYDMYAPLVREGGIVAFHDILLGGWHEEAKKKYGKEIKVAVIWNELKRSGNYKWKELVCGSTWAGIGILYV